MGQGAIVYGGHTVCGRTRRVGLRRDASYDMNLSSAHAFSIAPELLQSVALAQFGMEDVQHHVGVIHHDPAAGRVARAMVGPDPGLAQPTGNFIGNRFEVRLGGSGANQKIVGDCGNAAHIQNQHVFRLLVEGDIAAELDQFS